MLRDAIQEGFLSVLGFAAAVIWWNVLWIGAPAALLYGLHSLRDVTFPATVSQWGGAVSICYAGIVIVVLGRRMDEWLRGHGR